MRYIININIYGGRIPLHMFQYSDLKRTRPPRALVAHDLSGYGRCALTVVIPVLAVLGVQPVPLPTALLSTHTGGFTGFAMRDTTSDMRAIIDHWDILGLTFDAIYTGFLGSAEQIRVIASAFDRFGGSALKLVDPVMGDDGRLYSTITPELVNGMRELAARADLITPNLTEAHLLLGGDPATSNGTHTEDEVRRIAELLRERFSPTVVVTGVRCSDGTLSTACLEGENYNLITKPRIPKSYPGTGDIFASVLLGKLLHGSSLRDASEEASDFVRLAISDTAAAGTPEREGVLLEQNLFRLIAERHI